MNHFKLIVTIVLSMVALSCSAQQEKEIANIIRSVKSEAIPDSRYAVYEVRCVPNDNGLTLKGMVSSPQVRKMLIERLATATKKSIQDSLLLLPDTALGKKIYGIVNVSVCNVRATDSFSAEMSLQALLGTPVHILQNQMFYRIQTPDNYIGWVIHGGIKPMSEEEYEKWNHAEKIVVTSHYGFTHLQPDLSSQTVSDVVSGDRLKWLGTSGDFYKVGYPDGREAYISKSVCLTEKEWRSHLRQDASSIIKTAYSLMGVPYMWGANSAKGCDCSGFVRTVLYLHDIIIPRDASQMAYIGEHIDIAPDCSNLQPGDLIFFGRKAEEGKKEHVSHVALYVGNQHFIHSLGDVHEGSFFPGDANYDAYNLNRRLHAVRFLPYLNKEADINTTLTNLYYK